MTISSHRLNASAITVNSNGNSKIILHSNDDFGYRYNTMTFKTKELIHVSDTRSGSTTSRNLRLRKNQANSEHNLQSFDEGLPSIRI